MTYLTGRLTGRINTGSKTGLRAENTAFEPFDFDLGAEMIVQAYAMTEGAQSVAALAGVALTLATTLVF